MITNAVSGQAIYYTCSERALALYIVGISLGGWQDMYMERLVDSVVGRARDAMTISCVARGDSRVYM